MLLENSRNAHPPGKITFSHKWLKNNNHNPLVLFPQIRYTLILPEKEIKEINHLEEKNDT